jgi:hypothetical protein
MIEDELREILRELIAEIGATSARIIGDDTPPRTGVPARTFPLGGGEYLSVELPTRTNNTDIEAAFERTVRQLRAVRRRYEVTRLPEIAVTPASSEPEHGRVMAAIEKYMTALASIDRASNAFVLRGCKLVAAAKPPDELESSRWPFLARRALAAPTPGSSHGEIIDPDAYAMTFWYDASLVVLLAEPYATDFVRHRCRQVARELCNLLPMLDPDPEAPAAIGPRPRRPTQP